MTWYRKMFQDQVYLISNISQDTSQPLHEKPSGINHRDVFTNPGHIPGCCIGLQMGIDHLKAIGFQGIVVLTVPDTIADEGFVDILKTPMDRQVYTHDWGPNHAAMDFVVLAPEAWKVYEIPIMKGYMHGDMPVMQHSLGVFGAPAHSAALENWHYQYLESEHLSYKMFSQSDPDGAGWGTNVGTWYRLPECQFRVVQSGGDARPTKTHTTEKYHEFDIR